MIRIARGPEPASLVTARARYLAAAELEIVERGHAIGNADLDSGYNSARAVLHDAQAHRCAFCERPAGMSSQPTEHFRPRRGAERKREPHNGSVPSIWDGTRYWWLTWTWQNLLFSCRSCNDQGHKGNHFRVNPPALRHRSFNLASEHAMIVDPSVVDPLDHIRWQPTSQKGDPRTWSWAPRPITNEGAYTLKVFKWVEDDLQVVVTPMLQNEMIPKVLAAEQAPNKNAAWQGLSDLLYPGALFLAARWSVLEYFRIRQSSPFSAFPQQPRPGRHDPYVRVRGLPRCPAGVPRSAWLRILAGEELDEILFLLCSAKTCTVKDLQSILRHPRSRFSSETQKALRLRLNALVAAGRLRPAGKDAYST